MDWTKTKSILIIALIITNCILGVYIYNQKQMENVKWSNEKNELNEMIKVLEDRNIFINKSVVFEEEKAVNIEVAYQVFDINQEAYKFFGEDAVISDGFVTYKKEQLEILDTLLLYKNNGYREVSLSITEDEAQNMGHSYLEKHGFWTDDVYLSSINKDYKGYELMYKQQYNGKFIENSYMRLHVVNRGIQEFERKWFDILKVDREPVQIIPASKALFYLIGEIYEEDPARSSEVNIISVDLGYRLDTSIFSSNIYSGEVSPYWRIITEDNKEYFIKALE